MKIETIHVRALAKVNLDLRVLGRRPDGFHEIRSVFQTISLGDSLHIAYTPARTVRLDLESDLAISGNLVEKAVDLLALPGRFRVRLIKRIPIGGGLGGGSSDAAAILLSLPVLCGKSVPREKLIALAAQLGSDVPFFLLGGAAAAFGRGTELAPLPDMRPYPAALVAPGIHVSTADAYRLLDRPLTAAVPSSTIDSFQSFTWDAAERVAPFDWRCVNDFEAVVFGQYPRLKSIKRKLLKLGACPALMSGSGSSLFGIFANRGERDRAVVSLQAEYGNERVFSVSLVSRAAYRSMWSRQMQSVKRRPYITMGAVKY